MKLSKSIIILSSLLFSLYPAFSYADAIIESVSPDKALEGEKITINGKGFGGRTSDSYVQFQYKNQKINAKIVDWMDDKINVIVPLFPSEDEGDKIKISTSTDGTSLSNEKEIQFKVYSNKLVFGLIRLKKSGFSDRFILNHFDTYQKTSDTISDNIELNQSDMDKLKRAGFDDDVIASIAMHPQRLSLGVAGIWLYSTADIVNSPILRIFLKPKSYFEQRKPFWRKKCSFPLPLGLLDFEKYDINIGYTTKTSTDAGSEEKSYLLAGFSFELNRSALFNFGYALVPGDIEGKQTQFYFGITVDYNILKDLGILSKK